MALKTVEGRSAGKRSRPSDSVARQTDHSNIAAHRRPANAMTAIMDPQGFVVAVVASRIAARSFLREATR